MKMAIIARICGDYERLSRILGILSKEYNVESFACLGDMVGLRPQNIECIDLVRRKSTWSLLGMRDFSLFTTRPIGLPERYSSPMKALRDRLRPGFLDYFFKTQKWIRWKWLESLESARKEGDILFVYATPQNPLMSSSDIWVDQGDYHLRMCFEGFERICISSTSVSPGYIREDGTRERVLKEGELTIDISRGKCLVFPGSISGKQFSSFLILDHSKPDLITLRTV